MRLVCAGVALEAVFPERSRPRELVWHRGREGGWIGEARCVEGGGKMNETSVCWCCSQGRLPREVKT